MSKMHSSEECNKDPQFVNRVKCWSLQVLKFMICISIEVATERYAIKLFKFEMCYEFCDDMLIPYDVDDALCTLMMFW